jgi:hypothetical protein
MYIPYPELDVPIIVYTRLKCNDDIKDLTLLQLMYDTFIIQNRHTQQKWFNDDI